MRKTKISSHLFLLVFLGLTSCMTTNNIRTIEVEIVKPALFTMSKDIDTIAVFNRNLYKSDTVASKYLKINNFDTITDYNKQYRKLTNKCVDALANFLDTQGYFLQVINYGDSVNDLVSEADSLINYPEKLKKWKADAFIFLDYFELNNHIAPDVRFFYYNQIEDNFPELSKSTKLECIRANLFWTVAIKGDSAHYGCRQPDNLYYGNAVNPEFFGNNSNQIRMLENTSQYLGNSLGSKLTPSSLKVFRTYYRSNNVYMLMAEKYLVEGDWLKAAEIYNVQTKNKNRNIAAKASFNMALVCEMEGKIDPAIDWIVDSYDAYKLKNPDHQFNCEEYITLLAKRKREIELLKKQIR